MQIDWRSGSRAGAVFVLLGVLAAVYPGRVSAQGRVEARDEGALTLEEAVTLALDNNRDLAHARLSLEGANERVREAWGNVFPQVAFSSGLTRNLSVPVNFMPAAIFDPTAGPDELIPIRFGSDNQWSLQLQLQQPIFQAQAFIGVGAAARYRSLQDEAVRGTAQQIATRVRQAYYDVLVAREAVRLSENSVRRIRQTLEETRALREAGLASEYDVLRLEVQLANVEPELRRARDNEVAARRSLAVELGLEAVDTLQVAGSLVDVDLERETAGASGLTLRFAGLGAPESMTAREAVALAMERRSDLRQLELTEELRRTEVKAEKAKYFPTVSVFGLYTINAQENGELDFFGGDARYRAYGRRIGIQVDLPVFTGFKRPARVGQKEAQLRQAEVQYRLARARAENEVKTLLDRVKETRARARAQKLAVRQARRGYQIARARLREGVGSQLEVTDAEMALRQSEFNYAQAIYEYLTTRARLDLAVGTVPLVDTGDNARFDATRTTQ